jgi:hypothetical protein
MHSVIRYAAAGLAAVVVLALSACGSSGNNNQSTGGGGQTGGGGTSGNGGSSSCNSIATLPGWSGLYTACVNAGDTYTQLTNASEWEVLILQVPAGASVPGMSVCLPGGSGLTDLVVQAEFLSSCNEGGSGADYAVLPPGATLTSTSADGAPIHLTINIDYPATSENVTATGLADVIGERINPAQANVQAIITCANYVRSLPEINQSQPSSPEFWNAFADTTDCSQAFSTVSDALGLSGESAAADDSKVASAAEDITEGFFDDTLPKLATLVGEALFH